MFTDFNTDFLSKQFTGEIEDWNINFKEIDNETYRTRKERTFGSTTQGSR